MTVVRLFWLVLQHLESKAEQRNPDEFYFAMEKAKTKDGVHIQRCVQPWYCWPQSASGLFSTAAKLKDFPLTAAAAAAAAQK